MEVTGPQSANLPISGRWRYGPIIADVAEAAYFGRIAMSGSTSRIWSRIPTTYL